ncbi:PREDICTED: uncharacterized protein LOC107193222, partial [Dufourea novaeangliae]|uniref:uncharacterized protein LOC107193222 n=1 Tax=Dufourea novaeangliae TaxID=178035 RepID=UPI000767288F
MYRQIELSADHRKYHKILWREHRNHPIQTFILNTVTYGTASAPFLATRTLQQLAEDEGSSFPLAAHALQNDFYVDDMLTGAPTFTQAEILRDQLINLTAKGGFQLRQWASNDPRLIEPLQTFKDQHMTLSFTDSKKTLGLFWHPQNDTIGYSVKECDSLPKLTKRGILSCIAQLFDPLGLLGPIIVKAKLIMQELWKLNIHWDESVPFDIYSVWNEFQSQLVTIRQFNVPRLIIDDHTQNIQLHGFCDASERAYGACLYIRSTNIHGQHSVKLVCSKSRVAPLK